MITILEKTQTTQNQTEEPKAERIKQAQNMHCDPQAKLPKTPHKQPPIGNFNKKSTVREKAYTEQEKGRKEHKETGQNGGKGLTKGSRMCAV